MLTGGPFVFIIFILKITGDIAMNEQTEQDTQPLTDAELLTLIRDARHRICNDAPQFMDGVPGPTPPFKNPTYGPLLRRLDAADAQLAARIKNASPSPAGAIVESIAQQWEGCRYDSVGEDIDIADAIRRAGVRLMAEADIDPIVPIAEVISDTGLTMSAQRLPYYRGKRLPRGAKVYAPQSSVNKDPNA